MTYKFEQFNVEIVNPRIEVITILDTIASKTCEVLVNLVTDSTTFGVTLSGFTYTEDWNDTEVEAWTLTELEKYAV
jgi:uncharacterized protein YpbB